MKLVKGCALVGICLLALEGCGQDGVTGTGDDQKPTPTGSTPVTVRGAVQKGPFVLGSVVVGERLDTSGKATGELHFTKTTSDLGEFSLEVSAPGFIKVFASGYHFNEVLGALSGGQITLNALVDGTEKEISEAYVNVLTHLAFDREIVLLEAGAGGRDALNQAQTALVTQLGKIFPASNIPDFSTLSVYNVTTAKEEQNAFLLALSATVSQYATTRASQNSSSVDAELTEVLNKLADDFAGDATLDDDSIIQGLITASRALNPDRIVSNLNKRSVDVNHPELTVPNLNLYIDTDGDGQPNSSDLDDDNDSIPDEIDSEPYSPFEAKGTLMLDSQTIFFVPEREDLVTKVEYYADGVKIGESSDKPHFLISWIGYFWSGNGMPTVATKIFSTGSQSFDGPAQVLQFVMWPTLSPWGETVVTDTNSPTLSWMFGIPEADNEIAETEIQLWKQGSPETLIVSRVISDTRLVVGPLENGTYEWRVRCANSKGQWGIWGYVERLNIDVAL